MLQQLWRQGPWISEASPISLHTKYLSATLGETQPLSQPRSPTLMSQDRARAHREPAFNIVGILWGRRLPDNPETNGCPSASASLLLTPPHLLPEQGSHLSAHFLMP